MVSQWKLPYEKIPIDTEGVKFFAARIPRLEIEDEAHKNEHGIEVLLPFLLWANPQLKVVPIVIGDAELSDLELLASTLTEWRTDVVEQDGRAPLFVISSDLNHFSDETENRRRDELALDQLRAGNPEGLFQTFIENDISMCGMRPAVAILSASNSDWEGDVEITKYDTSAKVSGDSSRVVGYAGALLK